jgi:hypothetical protein
VTGVLIVTEPHHMLGAGLGPRLYQQQQPGRLPGQPRDRVELAHPGAELGRQRRITAAKLPADWKDRVVVFQNSSSVPERGICLEPHDLVVSKLVAGREKDRIFAAALLDAGLILASTLIERPHRLDELPGVIRRIVKWIEWWERRQSQGENGRPHPPDRSRHIALKKPCHLPVKVTYRVFELSDLRAL